MHTSSHTLTAAQSGRDVARAWRETHEPALIRDFVELLSYPNVAEDSVNVRRTASYIRDRLLDAGVAAELLEAGGTAIALPRDGERVDPESRLYARSAGDDKTPIAAILPVLRSFRESGVTPTSNLVFLFEGEEEAGSPHLKEYLETYRDRFDPVDVWLFFDGPAHQSGRPQLTFGMRGSVGIASAAMSTAL